MTKRPGKLFLGRKVLLPLVAAGMSALTGVASANPTGGVVQAGNITITDVAGLTTITQGDMRGIVNWQDFSIGALETTRFIQPSSSAATLNRVTGGLPSSLNGTLSANGHVFLINPNGVLVGAQGRVNTAGFVASSLDVPDGEFLGGGDMTFSGPSLAGVVNLGTITASHGDVVLMARTVANEGHISAPNGTAALAAGNEIFFKPSGNDRVVVKSASSGDGGGVRNSGTIEAAQAELKAAGGNTNGLAVNNSGIVRATGISKSKSGRVRLSAGGRGGSVVNTGRVIARNSDNSGGEVTLDGGSGGSAINEGTIDASAKEASKPGGTVEVLGDTITIGNGSVIDVSGSNGGLVAIGISALKAAQATNSGGIATLAQDPEARAAQQVTIHAGSSIKANATTVGDGGKIVSWAENRSVIGGVLEVKGGEFGGDGGLIETSAYRGLTISPETQISAVAPAGKAGTWLIDPVYDIFILAVPNILTNNGGALGFEPNGDDSYIGANLIRDLLNGGTSVTISTFSGVGAGAQAGNIQVQGEILTTTGGAATLQLNADGAIDIQANIAGTGASSLSLTLNAKGNITLGGALEIRVTDLTMGITGGTGDILLSGKVFANTLSADIQGGPGFNGSVAINNPLNQIGTINGINANQGIDLRDSGGGLIINNIISGGGFNPIPADEFDTILRTVGDFIINPGTTIFSNIAGDIFIEALNGYFTNNAGATALSPSPGLGGGWAIHSGSNATVGQGGLFNDGGIITGQAPTASHFGPAVFDTTDTTLRQFFFANQSGDPIVPAPTPVPAPAGGGGRPRVNSPIVAGMPLISESERLRVQREEQQRINALIAEVVDSDTSEPSSTMSAVVFAERIADNLEETASLQHYQGEEFIHAKIAEITDGVPEAVLADPRAAGIITSWVNQEMAKEYRQKRLAEQTATLEGLLLANDNLRKINQKQLKVLTDLLKLPPLAGGTLEMQIDGFNRQRALFEAAAKGRLNPGDLADFYDTINDTMGTLKVGDTAALTLQSAIKDTQSGLSNIQNAIDEYRQLFAALQGQIMSPKVTPNMTIQTDGNRSTVLKEFTVEIDAQGQATSNGRGAN